MHVLLWLWVVLHRGLLVMPSMGLVLCLLWEGCSFVRMCPHTIWRCFAPGGAGMASYFRSAVRGLSSQTYRLPKGVLVNILGLRMCMKTPVATRCLLCCAWPTAAYSIPLVIVVLVSVPSQKEKLGVGRSDLLHNPRLKGPWEMLATFLLFTYTSDSAHR